jgi:hypothetical protein
MRCLAIALVPIPHTQHSRLNAVLSGPAHTASASSPYFVMAVDASPWGQGQTSIAEEQTLHMQLQ